MTSGNQNLTDQDDADYAALNNERVRVTLTGLDGSGYLSGTWATVVGETGTPAYETDCTYDYTRHDDRFEQVMAPVFALLTMENAQCVADARVTPQIQRRLTVLGKKANFGTLTEKERAELAEMVEG